MITDIVPGSISAISQMSGRPLALSMMDCEIVILVDTSASMSDCDSRGGKSRYDVACEELRFLQANNPGKILVISFSDTALACLGGVPQYIGGGTLVSRALEYARPYDIPGMKIILISDGEPMDERQAFDVAKTYHNAISTIYVGPEDRPYGRDFLRRLAAATGGSTVTADRVKELATTVQTLLLTK